MVTTEMRYQLRPLVPFDPARDVRKLPSVFNLDALTTGVKWGQVWLGRERAWPKKDELARRMKSGTLVPPTAGMTFVNSSDPEPDELGEPDLAPEEEDALVLAPWEFSACFGALVDTVPLGDDAGGETLPIMGMEPGVRFGAQPVSVSVSHRYLIGIGISSVSVSVSHRYRYCIGTSSVFHRYRSRYLIGML